ncbi:MAG TPA: flagellar type III secretion system protein FlhB [Xanthobacteraceae bacterium]|jgi:flagellar biosynthetic protein FlhB|nr:flagellar type III secretion system protein FlhB [Xanthobacteraceae bacterium]
MADERDATEHTEDPTPKRLDEAVKRGDVVKSPEVNTWFMLAGGALTLMVFARPAAEGLEDAFRNVLANSYQIPADGPGLVDLTRRLALDVLAALGIPVLLLTLAALIGTAIQHRILFSVEPLTPHLSKISPAAGLRRLFSKQALANFAKGLAKLTIFGAVIASLLWPQRYRLAGLIGADPVLILPFTQSLAMQMLGTVVAILAIVAAADYLFQYRQWYERQKMSLREMKDEFRQTDGDPMVKGKIRQLRQSRMRKRMMAAVPKASLVITNPTHFAIALRYERGMSAPVCLAKGVDLIARRIREVAEAHGIPVIENPPLARALHATVDIDQEIPPEHYRAVAEIIGYLMRLRRLATR